MTRKVAMNRFLALRVTGRVMPLFVVALALAFVSAAMPALAQQADIGVIQRRFQEFYAAGNYSAALEEARKLESAVKARFGTNHANYGEALNNLAAVYAGQGKYGEAEGLFQRALAIREKALGRDHPDVAQTLNNLAAVYARQGRYGEAEGLYQRALAINEKALGRDHPDVAANLHNLAIVYADQGQVRRGGGALPAS